MASTTRDMERERLSTNAVVAWLGRGRPEISPDVVERAFCSQFAVRPEDITTSRHFPEDFFITFAHRHHRDAAVERRDFPYGNLDFRIRQWQLPTHGDNTDLKYHVRLCLEGIPLHAWNESIAKRVVASSCDLHYVEEQSLRREDTRALNLWALTANTSFIPKVTWLSLTDRMVEVHHGMEPPAGRRGLSFRVIVHLDLIEEPSTRDGRIPPPRDCKWRYGVVDGERTPRDRHDPPPTVHHDRHRRDDDDGQRPSRPPRQTTGVPGSSEAYHVPPKGDVSARNRDGDTTRTGALQQEGTAAPSATATTSATWCAGHRELLLPLVSAAAAGSGRVTAGRAGGLAPSRGLTAPQGRQHRRTDRAATRPASWTRRAATTIPPLSHPRSELVGKKRRTNMKRKNHTTKQLLKIPALPHRQHTPSCPGTNCCPVKNLQHQPRPLLQLAAQLPQCQPIPLLQKMGKHRLQRLNCNSSVRPLSKIVLVQGF